MSRHAGIISANHVIPGPPPPPSSDSWTENFPGTSPGDDGFFHWLRTRFDTVSELVLAQNGGMAKNIASDVPYYGTGVYAYRRATDNEPGTGLASLAISHEGSNEWFGWDLGSYARMNVSAYSLRCDYAPFYDRSWEFEVSDDGVTWTSVDSHTSDTTMNDNTLWYNFTVSGGSGSHQYFRLRTTGNNAAGYNIFSASGIEFYGDVEISRFFSVATDLRYTPDNQMGVFGYLSRLRNTEAYLHCETGSTATSDSFGRGFIEIEHGGYSFPHGDYCTRLTRDEFSALSNYCDVLSNSAGYWQVNLGPRRRVRPDHYVVGYRYGYANDILQWTFEGSNDGSTWDVLEDHTGVDDDFARLDLATYGTSNYQVISVPEQANFYQMFRVNPSVVFNGSEISLCSFEIFGDYEEDIPTLVSGATRYEQQGAIDGWDGICNAHTPTVTTSGGLFTGSTSQLFDGSLTTGPLIDNGGSDPWYKFDFGGSAKTRLETLVLGNDYNYTLTFKDLIIEGSNDNSTWDTLRVPPTDLFSVRRWYNISGGLMAIHIGSDVAYQYIRVKLTGLDSAGFRYFGLSSVEMYGDYVV